VNQTQILSLTNGLLYYGEDLILQRTVMLYNTAPIKGVPGEEYIRRLQKASSLIHDGFQHILDTSFEDHSIQIVLQRRLGKPLILELESQLWTFSSVISVVADLGVAMLEVMEERLATYSIGIENLWLNEEGKLSVINHWEEGNPQTRGASGLCTLLIQLFAGSDKSLGSVDAMDTYLNTFLSRLNPHQASKEQKDLLIQLVRRVNQGNASLSSLIYGLQGMRLRTNLSKQK